MKRGPRIRILPMSRPLELTLPSPLMVHLDALLETGLYGVRIEETAERMIARGVEMAIARDVRHA